MVARFSVLLSENFLLLICFPLLFLKADGSQCICNLGRLKNRSSLLRKYIDDTNLELQALFAVQALYVQLDYPPGTNVQTCCLSTIFSRLIVYFNLLLGVIEIIVRKSVAYPYGQLLIIPPQISVRPKANCIRLYACHIREF